MTDIVFKPEKAAKVNGRGLYRAYVNRKPINLLFRSRTTLDADAMLQYLLETQTDGKTIDFNLSDYVEGYDDGSKKQEEKQDDKDGKEKQDPEGDRPQDPAVREQSAAQ